MKATIYNFLFIWNSHGRYTKHQLLDREMAQQVRELTNQAWELELKSPSLALEFLKNLV